MEVLTLVWPTNVPCTSVHRGENSESSDSLRMPQLQRLSAFGSRYFCEQRIGHISNTRKNRIDPCFYTATFVTLATWAVFAKHHFICFVCISNNIHVCKTSAISEHLASQQSEFSNHRVAYLFSNRVTMHWAHQAIVPAQIRTRWHQTKNQMKSSQRENPNHLTSTKTQQRQHW